MSLFAKETTANGQIVEAEIVGIANRKQAVQILPSPADAVRQFNKRKLTLKKKAQQLQTLSDVTVCMVCFDADGEVTTWPEDKSQVDETIINYKLTLSGEGSKEKLKSNLNLLGFLDSKKRKIQKSKKKDIGNLFAKWEANLNKLQEKELVALCNCLELKLWGVREKIKVLTKMKEKGKAIQVYNNNGDKQKLNLESVFPSPCGFYSHSDGLWRCNSENFVPWGGNCNENIGFVGESSNCDKILNPFDSMVYQTPLHEALPMSIRQSPWPF
ncbi:uncharacterized protein LOC123208474 [Mangifera indica]|uniref:uncharacterized protein LOC123208474 n=1 Tax=Mangifera indica TaxID=29780 RepID=UPI001CFA3754|nr:uncharacterized protein LOC123208474 [Mangifera indica]